MTAAPGEWTAINPDDPLSEGSEKFGSTLVRMIGHGSAVILGGVRHIEPNMVPVALCAAVMFPAYWFVWKFLFPQPYENIWIRLFGSMLCLAVAAKDRWPKPLRRYLPLAWLATVLYCGPFFFTFMLLQNNSSTVWLLSMMAGLFLVVLLLDWISLFTLFITGSLLAWRIHLMMSPDATGVSIYLEYVPIVLFALTAGTIFNFKAAGMREAQERARLELGMLLAKEMKAPLISMRTNAASLNKYLPGLVRCYLQSDQQSTNNSNYARHLSALERVPVRIEEAVEQIDSMIEVLTTQGGEAGVGAWRASSMQRCLDDALARMPLAVDLARARIVIDRENDFLFQGSPVLMSHILSRVLDACMEEVYNATGAELVVSLGRENHRNFVRLADSSAPLARRATRISFGTWSTSRDFANRPDLVVANFVLARIGGSVSRTVSRRRIAETILWFPFAGG